MTWFNTLTRIGAWPVFAVFFLEAFVLGNWITRIPDVKSQFGFSASQLGLGLFMLSFGTMFSFITAGPIIRRLGLRKTNMLALPAWAILIGLVPFMPNGIVLGCLLVFAGGAVGFQEVAMNTAAENVSKESGTQIMSRSHGFWSLGSLFGALAGAGFAYFEITTKTHFAIVTPLTVLVALWCASALKDSADKSSREEPASSSTALLSLPSASLVLLCIMPIGVMLVEGAFIDWSAVFVQSVLAGGAIATGLIYAAFSSVMAATRLSGDAILDRFGPKRVAQFSTVSATLGIGLFATASNPTIAFVAALFAGLGVAIVYPLAITAAARRPGNDEDNVAAMSLFSFGAFMLAPPIIGFLADAVGLRYALLMLAPIAAMSFLLCGELEKGK